MEEEQEEEKEIHSSQRISLGCFSVEKFKLKSCLLKQRPVCALGANRSRAEKRQRSTGARDGGGNSVSRTDGGLLRHFHR